MSKLASQLQNRCSIGIAPYLTLNIQVGSHMSITTKTITVELTPEEFGALAGAVSTEWQKRVENGHSPASRYVGVRLQDAWMKMLRAWHPDVEDDHLAASDWVTMFQPSPITGDAVSDLVVNTTGKDSDEIAEVIPIR